MDTESVDTWVAVQVWAGREHLSARHLRQRGYAIFLPAYHESRRWSDRIKTIERALFPGYVFCHLYAHVAQKIVTTPGVIRIVGDANGPLPIPAGEIDALQRVIDNKLTREPWPFLRTGQRVRIQRGPLRGIDGVVLMVKSQRRLIVSLGLLQRSVAVDIEMDWVDSQDLTGSPSDFLNG